MIVDNKYTEANKSDRDKAVHALACIVVLLNYNMRKPGGMAAALTEYEDLTRILWTPMTNFDVKTRPIYVGCPDDGAHERDQSEMRKQVPWDLAFVAAHADDGAKFTHGAYVEMTATVTTPHVVRTAAETKRLATTIEWVETNLGKKLDEYVRRQRNMLQLDPGAYLPGQNKKRL
jgi:hypothetical protein